MIWYPPGEDPYKLPEINRQDRFFDDLNRVHEQILRDQRTASDAASAKLRAAPGPVATAIQPTGHAPRQPRTRSRPMVTAETRRRMRRRAILQMLAFCIVIDWILISAGYAPAWKVILGTALGVGLLIGTALLLGMLARALAAFLRSRAGRFAMLGAGGLATLYFVYGA